jgi:hypothetical protein
MMLRSLAILIAFAGLLVAAPASAEILIFQTGRVMQVASVRADGDRLQLTLVDGGEASVPASVIARIDPDEVPTPLPGDRQDGDAGFAPGEVPAVLASRPFAPLIAAAAANYGVDVRLVHAVIEAESNYEPRARSRTGAKGLMQLMPATARQYAVSDPYDPGANIDAGVRHLKYLLGRFDVGLALAAYNAGEGAVRVYGGLPPFTETRNYVARILRQIGR